MRSFVTAVALLFAAAFALDLAAPTDACCSVEGCRRDDAVGTEETVVDESADEAGAHRDGRCASDECPPGCDDGCACCARLTGVPATTWPALGALVVHTVVYPGETEVAPPAPEPRDRDAVPRRVRAA